MIEQGKHKNRCREREGFAKPDIVGQQIACLAMKAVVDNASLDEALLPGPENLAALIDGAIGENSFGRDLVRAGLAVAD